MALDDDHDGYIPIDWPIDWQKEKRYFWEGFPIFSPHRKVIHTAKEILLQRDSCSFEKIWKHKGYDSQKCRLLAMLIQAVMREFIKWPNHYFLPNDQSAIILGNIRGVAFDCEDPVNDLAKYFGIYHNRTKTIFLYKIIMQQKLEILFNFLIMSQDL